MDGSGVETGGVGTMGTLLPGGPKGGNINGGGDDPDGGEPGPAGGVDVGPADDPTGGMNHVGPPSNVLSGGT